MDCEKNVFFRLIEHNEDFVLISKNPGVHFHKNDGFCGLCACVKNIIGCNKLYPLHRLDTMTSGLILFAKNRSSVKELADQFASQSIEKYYLAIGGNKPVKKQGRVIGTMVRSRRGGWKLMALVEYNRAITSFLSAGLGNGFRLYLCKPLTGKTHQIRVALKAIGAPVFGDPKYGKAVYDNGADRGYLHSYALKFSLKGKEFKFIDTPVCGKLFLSEEFKRTFEKFADPWNLL